jgi:hypothetical protein
VSGLEASLALIGGLIVVLALLGAAAAAGIYLIFRAENR